jgi:regulatory subunit for Cdc7p protein kinase
MATVSIVNSPHTLSTMSGRRVPLSNNPNAANSPYRAAAGAPKQKRSYATVQREEAYGQPPPAKKQMVKVNQMSLKTPSRQSLANGAESRLFTRKSTATASTNFARKLEAARVKPSQLSQSATDNEASLKNLETIRQWQRHYRKVFPKCVFYFESISEELRIRFSKQVVALGAVSVSLLYKRRLLNTNYNIARGEIFFKCCHTCRY